MICIMAHYGSVDDGPRPGGIVRATAIAAMPHQARPAPDRAAIEHCQIQTVDIVARRGCEFKMDVAPATTQQESLGG